MLYHWDSSNLSRTVLNNKPIIQKYCCKLYLELWLRLYMRISTHDDICNHPSEDLQQCFEHAESEKVESVHPPI